MKRNLTPELKHEISCLKNTNKQLKSANEYHKSKVEMYEVEMTRMLGDMKQCGIAIALLFLTLFWSNVYHFLN